MPSTHKGLCRWWPISPLLVEEKHKPIEGRYAVVQKYLLGFAQQGASQSDIPEQGACTPSKPRDIVYLT